MKDSTRKALEVARNALDIIAGGHISRFPGAPDVMTSTPDEFRHAMWTWSQSVAKSAIAPISDELRHIHVSGETVGKERDTCAVCDHDIRHQDHLYTKDQSNG